MQPSHAAPCKHAKPWHGCHRQQPHPQFNQALNTAGSQHAAPSAILRKHYSKPDTAPAKHHCF
eukprot:6751500-Lingulodinium_polyedra.AAC.1